MTKKNDLLAPAYEALKEAKDALSGLEAIIVGMEDDLNAVEAMGEKIVALQATVEGLEARIAAECKHSEEVWEVAYEWKQVAGSLARHCNENMVPIPSAFMVRDIPNKKCGGGDA